VEEGKRGRELHNQKGEMVMTKTQKHIIKCAYLDLKGSKEAALELTIEDHDWKAHKHTIEDMESVFPFLKELLK
jgi:hypothetical protein